MHSGAHQSIPAHLIPPSSFHHHKTKAQMNFTPIHPASLHSSHISPPASQAITKPKPSPAPPSSASSLYPSCSPRSSPRSPSFPIAPSIPRQPLTLAPFLRSRNPRTYSLPQSSVALYRSQQSPSVLAQKKNKTKSQTTRHASPHHPARRLFGVPARLSCPRIARTHYLHLRFSHA